MKKLLFIAVTAIFCLGVKAQYNSQIIIETKNSVIVLSIGSNKRVSQSYFGKKLSATGYSQLNGGREVYLTSGMENQFEPAIRMVHAEGNPSLELQYVSHTTTKTDDNIITTNITLKDPKYPVEVVLHYTTYYNEDVIKSWTDIRQQEKKTSITYGIRFIHVTF